MYTYDPTGELHRAQQRRELKYAATYAASLLLILVLVLFWGAK